MDYLIEHILWWHWIVLGLLLMAGEILLSGFILLWFGLAAIVVGFVVVLTELAFTPSLYLWIALSVLFLFLYYRFFRRHEPVPAVGQSDGDYAGVEGVVVEELDEGRYRARFDLPILGDRIWTVESEGSEPLHVGDRVKVSHVYGQIVKVTPSNEGARS